MSSEKRWESLANLEKKKATLFERKFIDYRDKLLYMYYALEEEHPLREEIKDFLETEQGDVQFESSK